MFLKFWIIYAIVGLSIATWLFRWALHSGQFAESRRAGLLPLDDVAPSPNPPRTGRLHLILLVALVAVGILTAAVTAVLTFLRG